MLAVLALTLGGAVTGVAVAGAAEHSMGPLTVRLHATPSWHGGTRIEVAPLGSLFLRSHAGPVGLTASVVQLDPARTEQLIRDPAGLSSVSEEITADLRGALRALAVRTAAAAVLGAALLNLLVLRRGRVALLAAAMALTGTGLVAGVAASTWRPRSVDEPRYSGLLVSAPTAVGSLQSIVTDFDSYRGALTQLVGNVTELYRVGSSLPTFTPGPDTIVVLHVSDLHLNPEGVDLTAALVKQFGAEAVLDSGDLTDHGSAPEGTFVNSLRRVGVPYVFVRGNHDSAGTARQVAALPGAVVLDGTTAVVAGLHVAGIADTRFTPDKDTPAVDQSALLAGSGAALAGVVRSASTPVDLALVHDPAAAGALDGAVPLVLSGHLHHRETATAGGTLHLAGGSTGGAGLRGLEGEEPTPLEASVLYLSRSTHRLLAWDEVTVGGLGTSSVEVQRRLPPLVPVPAGAPEAAGAPAAPTDQPGAVAPRPRRRG